MAGAFLDRVSNKALGQMLMEKGALTAEQLEEALNTSRDQGIRLGEALVSLGYLTPDALGYAIGEQYGLTPMELQPSMLDQSLISRFDSELLKRHTMLPLIQIGDQLVVVVSDPNEQTGLAHLAAQYPQLEITPQLGAADQIRRCLAALSSKTDIDDRSGRDTKPWPVRNLGDLTTPNQPEGDAFYEWLSGLAVQNFPREIAIRNQGQQLQVSLFPEANTAQGDSLELEEVKTFPRRDMGDLAAELLQHTTQLEFTRGLAFRWNETIEYGNALHQVLVLTSPPGAPAGFMLRCLRSTAPSHRLEAPAVRSGQVSSMVYNGQREAHGTISSLVASLAPRQSIILSQLSTNALFAGGLTLPAPVGDVPAAVQGVGATCVMWDHVPPVEAVERVLLARRPAPAIFFWVDETEESSPAATDILKRFNVNRVRCADLPEISTGGTN